ncbi:hypothetical protein GBAR_LOCUS763, partial [Geodia barretti]
MIGSVGDLDYVIISYRYREAGAFPSLSGAISPHSSASGTISRVNELTVQCHRKKTAPCEMTRGSATTDGTFAYFTPDDSTSVYQYGCSTEKWEELPS